MTRTRTGAARRTPSRRRRAVAASAALALTATGLFAASTANAAGDATLPGSNFEIEEDANLQQNNAAPSIDWLTPSVISGGVVKADMPTGQGDDSYKGGTKEDTACPAETTGSIPNNKSDLLTFRVWVEPGAGSHPGFLNLAWQRVTDPSGTTLMDFEFNKSGVDCDQGPNKVRSVGDRLIEYLIDQGGKRAEITIRSWTGSEWGPPELLSDGTGCDGGPCAVGTINQSVIPEADSGTTGGDLSQYTFGEAQIDLRTIFQPGKCESFGSAMLKSRSSDAFTSQLKDFIRPEPITLTNCGKVIIRKETIPDGEPGSFAFVKSFGTDPSTANTFSLSDGGAMTFDNVLFGSNLTVTEDLTQLPAGFTFDNVNCSAGNVTPSDITGAVVTFDIDSATDVLDCTYTNRALATFTVKKVLDPATSSETFSFTPGGTLPSGDFTLGHNATKVYSNLAPGSVSATEDTAKAGWDLVDVTCTKTNTGSGATATVTLAAGDDVTCTFTNRQRATIVIIKVDDTGAPLVGAAFTASAAGQPDAMCTTALVDHDSDATTPDRAQCTLGNLVPNLEYTVTETTTPTGYQTADPQAVTPTPGQTVELTFVNPRLFRVIAFVCQESDNTLYGASASFGATRSTQSTAISSFGGLTLTDEQKAALQEALCSLDAKFPGLTTGTYSGSVTIE